VLFEDVMWERTIGTNWSTATFLKTDLSSYIPKPVFMYQNPQETLSPSIYLKDGGSTTAFSVYQRYSNEISLGATDLSYVQSLNFGAEISAWDYLISFMGLYEKFYSNYIENLFNKKTRAIKIKATLTAYLLNTLRLNDRLVISNKRYLINSMNTNPITKVVDFDLITDSRILGEQNVALRFTNIPILTVDNTAQRIQIQLYLLDNSVYRSKVATGFLVSAYTPTGNKYEDSIMYVDIPINTSGLERIDSILFEYFDKQGNSINQSIPVTQNA
jgi:hypothetical protein